jgi:O-glycosyl hydrolase
MTLRHLAVAGTTRSIAQAVTLTTLLLGPVAMAAEVVTSQDEELFWSCNLAANEERLTNSSIRECSVVYNKILTHRFGGDFLAYLTWRKANEVEQLRQLRTTALLEL